MKRWEEFNIETYMGFNLELNDEDNYSIVEYVEDEEYVRIPETFNLRKIDTIKSCAFFEKVNLKQLKIPDSIKKIEKNAFVFLPNLEDVFLENYYPKIINCFEDCAIDICMIVEDGFYLRYKETNLTYCFFKKTEYLAQQMGMGLTFDIKKNTLKVNKSYQTLYIPDHYKGLLLETNLEEVEYIKDNDYNLISSYSNFYQLVGARISKNIVEIPESYFMFTNIRFINIPDKTKRINKKAFYLCKSLSTVNFPKSLEEVLEDAFHGTRFIQKFSETGQNKKLLITYDNIIFGCNKDLYNEGLKELYIPENVTAIAANSISLPVEKIILNKSIKKISERAFFNCLKLKEVFIPKNIEYIGDYAFGYNSYLHTRLQNINVKYEDKSKTNVAINAFQDDREISF